MSFASRVLTPSSIPKPAHRLPRISSTWKRTAPVAAADPIRDLHLLERVPVEPLLVVTPAEVRPAHSVAKGITVVHSRIDDNADDNVRHH
jgi:hypothetical protein